MIDWPHVDELRADMGESFGEIVEVFLEDVAEGLKMLGAADLDDRAAALHFLKGAALNLGFSQFAGLCASGEVDANEGRSRDVDLAAINASFEASKHEFLVGLEQRAA